MKDNLSLAEEKFNEYLPVLRSMYPETRRNKAKIKELISIYKNVQFYENVLIALYDHRTASLLYMGDNTEQVVGHTKEKMLKWGGLLLFKILDYSHYSYPFTSLKIGNKFNEKISLKERKEFKFYCSGLKFVDNKKQIRRPFFKNKTLLLDENGQTDISVTFIEDITHLVKGDHYWMRFESGDNTQVHVHQKGKKDFKELLSEKEIDVLRLVATHKTNIEIATQLNLSKLTVETHRKNMLKRAGAVDTTALIHLCKMANIL